MKRYAAHSTILSYFKQWSRKHYAIMTSLSRIIRIGFLNTIYTIVSHGPVPLSAQHDSIPVSAQILNIEEIRVLGQKNHTIFQQIPRMVIVIEQEDLDAAPVQSIQELLEHIAAVDIRQRGLPGVQADLSLRGGSFDHTMVLLNGIVLSDPQTGHFNLDIPVDLDAIERIEILYGTAARIYGAGAFTGAVNIVVKPDSKDFLKGTLAYGQYGYNRLGLTGSLPKGKTYNLLNISHSGSSGYDANTGFSMENLYYTGHACLMSSTLRLQAAYQQKEFGANGFYSPRYPDQYEATKTSLLSLDLKTGTRFIVRTSAYWRRKYDHFMLQHTHPSFYQNYHRNQSAGAQVTGQFVIGKITSLSGLDAKYEHIISTSIGTENPHPVKIRTEDSLWYTKQYDRTTISGFQDFAFNTKKLSVTAGFMVNWNSDSLAMPALFPGFDMNYSFNKTFRAFISLNRSLRYPSFTDMFYTDPSHQGNRWLDPDRMVSAEAGLHAKMPFFSASLILYKSDGKDIIDWLWSFETNRYNPVNIDRFSVSGIEIQADLSLEKASDIHSPVKDIKLGYNFMDVNKSTTDSLAKYYNVKHKLTFSICHRILHHVSASWYLCYQDRLGSYILYREADQTYSATEYKPFFLLDGKISWEIRNAVAFLEVSNLLNVHYVDAGSVFQPGRWCRFGIKFNLEIRPKSTS